MKKILYVSHSADINGAEQCLLTLIQHLNREIYTPVVVLPGDGSLKRKLDILNVKTIIVPLLWWIDIIKVNKTLPNDDLMKRSHRLVSIIEMEDIDIVHTNTSVIVEGAIAAKLTGKPHLWHLHEILKGHPRLKPLLPLYLTYKFIELLSDSIVVVSNEHKKSLMPGINPVLISVIYNGTNFLEGDIQCNKSFREEIGVPNNSFLVCTIGPVIKEKGYDNYAEAARQILGKRQDVRFISVGDIGDKELFTSIQNILGDLISMRYVQFIGYRNDIGRILKEIDLYVVSSQSESFGLAAVEAMSAGKPVVATRCGGPEEIVIDGETGIMVPVNNSKELVDAIIYLMNNPDKRNEMGLKGKKRFEMFFTSDSYCKAFENLYDRLELKRKVSLEEEKLTDAIIEILHDLENTQHALHMKQEELKNIVNTPKWRLTTIGRRLYGYTRRAFHCGGVRLVVKRTVKYIGRRL